VTSVSREAKYQQIADDLRSAIASGRYLAGDRLPGENGLMARYGVARMTARHALDVLQQEGLTTTKKGVGVFVRGFQPIIRLGVERLSREQWGSGRSIWEVDVTTRERSVDRITVTETAAGPHVAAALDITEDAPVVVRDRRYLLDGRPVMLGVSSYPADIAVGTQIAEHDTGPGGVYKRLSELGHEPVRFREDIRGRMPSADEREALELEGGTPVITVHRTALTVDGTPVEFTEMTLDSATYVLRYEFDA
jgi:GntR family transcriptional regulator